MKIRFYPPDMFLVYIGLQILSHFLFPIKQLILLPYNYIGILLIIVGEIPNFYIPIRYRFKKTRNVDETPKTLMTSGFYTISRNPVYLGMNIVLLGVAILLGSLITFIFPILFFILNEIFVIPIEERNMEKTLGKKYLEYKEKVRRWI